MPYRIGMPTIIRPEKLEVHDLQILFSVIPDDNQRTESAKATTLQLCWKDKSNTVHTHSIASISELLPIMGEHMTDQVRRAFQEALGNKSHAPSRRQDL